MATEYTTARGHQSEELKEALRAVNAASDDLYAAHRACEFAPEGTTPQQYRERFVRYLEAVARDRAARALYTRLYADYYWRT